MSKPTLDATFQPQQWIDDDAVDCGPSVRFDAADAVLSLSPDQLATLDAEVRRFGGRDLDVVAEKAGLAGLGGENDSHPGPFYVDIDASDWDGFLTQLGIDPNAVSEEEIAAAREQSGAAPTPR